MKGKTKRAVAGADQKALKFYREAFRLSLDDDKTGCFAWLLALRKRDEGCLGDLCKRCPTLFLCEAFLYDYFIHKKASPAAAKAKEAGR